MAPIREKMCSSNIPVETGARVKPGRVEAFHVGVMLDDAFERLAEVAGRMKRHGGPPPAPLPVERVAARREAIIPPRVRLDLQLDRIDRGWGLP